MTRNDAFAIGPIPRPLPATPRLQEVLDAHEASQSELARRSGVSLVTINGIANNRTTRVDLATLDAISGALEIEPGELLEREPEPKRGRRA